MIQRFNKTYFEAISKDGQVLNFLAYLTNTRNGFCHTVITLYKNGVTDTKVSYLNRTWECYEYETVLKRAIEKNGLKYSECTVNEICGQYKYNKHIAA